jgi:hypothetical protein
MAKSSNEALKKHHFWILAGVAPLLVLLAVIFLMTGVSSAISQQRDEVEKSIKDVTSASPPGEGVLADFARQKEILEKKKGELWKENWERQKPFFTWPRARRNEFDKYKDLKFGETLKETVDEFQVFTRNYIEQYEELAQSIRPTRFAGGWRSVLRYVANWGEVTPRSEQIWLALEDLWVQRAMLDPINVVNQETATFTPVPDPQSTPLKRKFRSRIWDLTLEVADQGQYKILKGKLRNRTSQLQLLGVGNVMRLHVWFDNNRNVDPMWFDVQGEFVPGDTEIDIPQLPYHFLPPGFLPTEISHVKQVLDERTVPIRRVDRLVLGYLSSKDATKELQPPKFWPESEGYDGMGGSSFGRGMMSGGGEGEGLPGGAPGEGYGGMPGGPMMPGMFGGAGGTAAAGSPAGVLDAQRNRYLEVTDQVRRMPVAIVLVVDQMFIPDVLVAYSNSPFRFYTVQTHWRRFHGSLSSTGMGGGMMGGGGMPSMPGGGMMLGPMMPGMSGGAGGSPDDEGYGVSGFAGDGLVGSYSGRGGYGGMYGGGFSGLGSGTVSEAQANAGLVELTIYGIISLYEKYEEQETETIDTPDNEKPDVDPTTGEPTGQTDSPPMPKKSNESDTAPLSPSGDAPVETPREPAPPPGNVDDPKP